MSTDATNQGLFGGITCNSGALPGPANKGNHYQPSIPSRQGEINFAPDWSNPYEISLLDECGGPVAAMGAQLGFRAVLRAVNDKIGVSGYLSTLDVVALERMAIDPGTPRDVLEQISLHPSADLRAVLAENRSTPEETMWKLASDRDPDVRYQLAENPHIAASLLRSLAEDENPYVASRAQQTLSRIRAI
jgi:hypothetical protein